MSTEQHNFATTQPTTARLTGTLPTVNRLTHASTAIAHLLKTHGLVAEGGTREGLKETPLRAAKAWEYWLGGYDIDPLKELKHFEDGAENYDQMVIVRDIRFYSMCEHHLAQIIGYATVAYLPNEKIVGLSKIVRVVDAFARRLQVQERMTTQIAHTLWQGLEPIGVAVQVRARHMCMESRGVRSIDTPTITQALLGVFKEDQAARMEFIELAKSSAPI